MKKENNCLKNGLILMIHRESKNLSSLQERKYEFYLIFPSLLLQFKIIPFHKLPPKYI